MEERSVGSVSFARKKRLLDKLLRLLPAKLACFGACYCVKQKGTAESKAIPLALERAIACSGKGQRNQRPYQTGKMRIRYSVNQHLSRICLSVEKCHPDGKPLGHMMSNVNQPIVSTRCNKKKISKV